MSTTTRVKVRHWSPTGEQAELLLATEATRSFLRDMPANLRQRYAGQWIAAKDCHIVAEAATRSELSAKLGQPRDPAVVILRLEKGVSIRSVAELAQRHRFTLAEELEDELPILLYCDVLAATHDPVLARWRRS